MTEPTLTLTARRGGQTPMQTANGLEVTAEWEWLLHGPQEHIVAAHEALSGVSELITDGLLLISFGNAVGIVDIPHLGRVNVISGKWHEHHYQHMLDEVTEIAAGLPFSASSATALPYERSVAAQEDVLYHMFTYLRHILNEHALPEQQLLPALRQILHDPHQRFQASRTMVPLASAQQIDATSLLQLAAGVGGIVNAPTGLRGASQLAHVLNGHLPEYIDEPQIVHSVDTLENRFVKMVLATAMAIIERTQQTLRNVRRPSAFSTRVLQDCDRMARALRPIVQHDLWRQVGTLNQLPTASTVLQGRRGYREVYQHYIRLRLATQVPLSAAQARDLLESKDIALLYEIWCFFALVRVLTELIGLPEQADRPRASALELHIPWDLVVRWSNGAALFYNPRFSRSRSPGRRSYSVPLRPDIALELPTPDGKMLHLFDAKFKVDRLDTLIPSSDEADETISNDAIEERRGIFKRGDIYKMHTYHDAIPAARSVWILYPGTETSFFDASGDVALWQPVAPLPSPLSGVGALAFAPDAGQHDSPLAVLEHMLREAGYRARSDNQHNPD